ncbi:MAG: hypothetical protein OXI38_07750 [Bacteroidota bacterium]|nr:hypothetical protein [Bacteroidota bacterium]
MLAKVANALGIAWYFVGDDDSAGRRIADKLKRHLNGAKEVDRISLPYPNIEVGLLRNGYQELYDSHMSDRKMGEIKKRPGEPEYCREYVKVLSRMRGGRKTRAAAEVADAMESKGPGGVPEAIRRVLAKVQILATDADS